MRTHLAEVHMTDNPSAPPCPEWARQWRPRTKDGAAALALYDDATICGIAETLRGLAEGADQDVLAGLIRQWGSQHLAVRRGVGDRPGADDRDKLRTAAAHLRAAKAVLDKIPDVAMAAAVEPRGDGDGLRDWARNLDSALSMPRVVEECAAVAEQAAEAVKVDRRRPPDHGLQVAIKQLCWIYHIVTGRLPGRWFNHYAEQGDGGPFERFVTAAIRPLWPNAGRAGRNVRAALLWYKNRLSNTQ